MSSSQGAGERTAFKEYADWYDAFNPAKDYGAEATYLLRHIEEISGTPRRWLDIGCGTGRHLAEIKSRGIDVEGLDRSKAMIAWARVAHPDIPFHVATAQDFNLSGDRDVVSMLFHVLNYQYSDDMIAAAMSRIRAHLAPKGVFVFDFWNTDAVVVDPPTSRVRQAVVDGRPLFRLTRPVEDRARRLIEVNYQFRWDVSDGPLAHEEKHLMRHFTIAELETCLRGAGMTVVRSEAWMAGRPLTSSDWYGFVCACRTTDGR